MVVGEVRPELRRRDPEGEGLGPRPEVGRSYLGRVLAERSVEAPAVVTAAASSSPFHHEGAPVGLSAGVAVYRDHMASAFSRASCHAATVSSDCDRIRCSTRLMNWSGRRASRSIPRAVAHPSKAVRFATDQSRSAQTVG